MCRRDVQTAGLRAGDEGDGAYLLESEDLQPYRRPQMTGKARDEEEHVYLKTKYQFH